MPVPGTILSQRVLIIAELTLPQCAKYRVWQKQEHFRRLGVACQVVDWRSTQPCISAAQLATLAILYRVPAYPEIDHLIAVLHGLRVPTLWEVDDLIFDQRLFLENRNIDMLDAELREGVLSGVHLYRNAMLACGAGIASTPDLAAAMSGAGLADITVIENALDDETLEIAAQIRQHRATLPQLRIAYGSGTKTHDADFQQAAPALLRLMHANPDIQLRIIGELTLPAEFHQFGAQVERLPPMPYASYLRSLAEADISLAPLEPTIFNDAKSNIKFLEAAILGLPSVCSPRANFRAVIRDGENGLLASGDDGWFAALSLLAADAALRHTLGQAALHSVLERYAPENIAQNQVAPLLNRAPDQRETATLRVLFANVYYAPQSYGGATLVVEEMARRLAARPDTEISVFTSLPKDDPDWAMRRTSQDGITVIAVPVTEHDVVAEFDDPSIALQFADVLDAVQPHVVHLHSLQRLSATIAAACVSRNIPYVITLHDAWWICARQFMVTGEGSYCFQRKIDLNICQNCLPGAQHLRQRQALLRSALDGAALLLSPSAAHRSLYLANGVPPDRIEIAPNGVRLPTKPVARRPHPGPLRFAYVGGKVEVKGYSVTKRAFEALQRSDWQLVLVDNTLNLGFSSVSIADWNVRGDITIVPAYAQNEMDAFFAGIDVLVFPSQWQESFGLTVREALARHVWVIATEGGGPSEAIDDGVNGTLIPLDGRHESLQQAIEALLDKPHDAAAYRNPHADNVMDYASQAEWLRARLARLASHAPAMSPATRMGCHVG